MCFHVEFTNGKRIDIYGCLNIIDAREYAEKAEPGITIKTIEKKTSRSAAIQST